MLLWIEMPMKTVALVFGGRSAEHDVSILSAKNVYTAVDKSAFSIHIVYQRRDGEILLVKNFDNLSGEPADLSFWKTIDVAFPVMHGPHCEDGSIQGFFETIGVAYVGSKLLGSALCMDKDIQKHISRSNSIAVTDWLAIRASEYPEKKDGIASAIERDFGFPVFVKPCNLGSSIGISKVIDATQLDTAIVTAFSYDTKIIIERAVFGRELEVAILGSGDDLLVSEPGEVTTAGSHDFYDYDAKYTDEHGSQIFIPATNIVPEKVAELQALSKNIFVALECNGLARIDFFMDTNNAFILNEVNTIPGFTNISMYPKLMEHTGVSYTDLVTRLLNSACKR